MVALTVIVIAVALVLLLPLLSDLVSLAWIALGRPRPGVTAPAGPPPRLLFLVPAHDEEMLIGECVRSLVAQRYPRDALAVVVVADNCGDRTAECARRAGADTLERDDDSRRGKPHAIAWALKRVALPEYDAVVIVDADCVVDPGFASALAARGPLNSKAVQPYNDVRNPDETPLTRLAATFAVALYRFAYRLKRAAGLNVPMSAGMCLGTAWLAREGWTAFSLSEDWELYGRLTRQGVQVDLAPGAHLYAQEAATLEQSAGQRTRWTAGKLQALLREGPAIVRSRSAGLRAKLDAIAELSAPGPAVHFALAAGLALVAIATRAPGALAGAALLGAGLSRPACYAVAALAVDAEPAGAIAACVHLPGYMLWRIGTAARLVRAMPRKTAWVRTARRAAGEAVRPPVTPG